MENPYRSRGYLPHLEDRGLTYFLTLRLAGTLPQAVLSQIRKDLEDLRQARRDKKLNAAEEQRLKYIETKRIQDYLDSGAGECWLANSKVAEVIQEAVRHHDGHRYVTHVCCIMPNHLHWILTPQKTKGMLKLDSRIIPIMQGFKSFTAHAANKVLRRNGPFWSREYYDHAVKSSEEFYRLVRYTIQNPVKAKLCADWKQWPWTICSKTLMEALRQDESL
jgi:REP element-mobilizing transposase RayT